MNDINLISLINAKNKLNEDNFKLYLSQFGIEELKKKEFVDLELLILQIKKESDKLILLDEYYVGYKIKQISKEFDLLRFGENSIINIELKNKNTEEKMKKQLLQNKYYLSFLNKKLFCFTYISEDNTLLYLDENEEMREVSISFLISKLEKQKLIEIDDIDKLFDPCNYLVSPFNSPKEFIEGKYFLTDHQINIKKDISKILQEVSNSFIAIEGAAGTGKTLLIYDIAKDLINNSKEVIIFHCGNINSGQDKLNNTYNWNIVPIKNCSNYDISKYDLVIVDETQRIYKYQLDLLVNNIKKSNAKCIFSYDGLQCLANKEIENDIPKYIRNEISPKHFKLTDKIRTNKEIASFIKNIFDLNKENLNIKYTNVNIKYFSNCLDVIEYKDMLFNKGWKIIEYTPSNYENYPYYRYQEWGVNAHKVIGQEYDNVVAVIDEFFYYRDDGLLSIKGFVPYYHMTKMLFQILTRARKRICIIIINNEDILEKCIKILQNKHINLSDIKKNINSIETKEIEKV